MDLSDFGLTEQELAVLELLQLGFTNPQIGAKLQISHHTAKAHVGSILRKIGAKNRTEAAVVFAKANH